MSNEIRAILESDSGTMTFEINQGSRGGGGDGHSPYIGANGNWYEWSDSQGRYVDTGVKAEGTAATISVGSTTTGEPGTQASVINTGTSSAAVLRFTIPAGEAGVPGADGREIEIHVADGYIQWRYVGESGWVDLVSVEDLEGENGATFTPSVSEAGVISWTNDKGLPNPPSRDIVGPKGADGTGVTILGSYDTYDELVAAHPTGNPGDSYLVAGDLYVWSAEISGWSNVGRIQGPPGERGGDGITPTIAIGTVATGEPGTHASVANSGTSSAAIFDFVIPQGGRGPAGTTIYTDLTDKPQINGVTLTGNKTTADLGIDSGIETLVGTEAEPIVMEHLEDGKLYNLSGIMRVSMTYSTTFDLDEMMVRFPFGEIYLDVSGLYAVGRADESGYKKLTLLNWRNYNMDEEGNTADDTAITITQISLSWMYAQGYSMFDTAYGIPVNWCGQSIVLQNSGVVNGQLYNVVGTTVKHNTSSVESYTFAAPNARGWGIDYYNLTEYGGLSGQPYVFTSLPFQCLEGAHYYPCIHVVEVRSTGITERYINLNETHGRNILNSATTSGTIPIDLSIPDSNIYRISPTSTVTLTLQNATVNAGKLKEFEVWITMPTTLYAVTWFPGITWLDGVPTLEAGKTHVITFRTTDGVSFVGNLAYSY